MEYSRVYENAQVLLLSIQVAAVVVLGGLVVFVLNLGCEVVADVANVADVVLHHQGDLNKNSHIIPRCILGLGYFGHTNK